MLIKVTQQKLTLGRSVYQRGDVFECPPGEAQMMVAIGLGQFATTEKATREPPQAPPGFSIKGPTKVSHIPVRAKRVTAAALKE